MAEDTRKSIYVFATKQSYLDKAKEKLAKFENNAKFKQYVKEVEYALVPDFCDSHIVDGAIRCAYGRFAGERGLELLVEQLEEELNFLEKNPKKKNICPACKREL